MNIVNFCIFGLIVLGTCAGGQAMHESVPNEPSAGIYTHFRTGNKYEVLGIARYVEEPKQEFVVYKQLYQSTLQPGDTPLPVGTLWIRAKEKFLENVPNAKGELVPRFKKV